MGEPMHSFIICGEMHEMEQALYDHFLNSKTKEAPKKKKEPKPLPKEYIMKAVDNKVVADEDKKEEVVDVPVDNDFLGGFDAFDDYGDEDAPKKEEKKPEPPKEEPPKKKKEPKPLPKEYIMKAVDNKVVADEDKKEEVVGNVGDAAFLDGFDAFDNDDY
jgi:hypothetical protein